MKLLITIVQRGRGDEVTNLISKCKVDFSAIFLGQGTASNTMMEYLSLVDTKKEIVFSLIDDSDEKIILDTLIDRKHHGSAFTMSLTSINWLAFKHLMGSEV